MIAIKDMEIPRFCAECRFMLAGTWKDGKEYPCICYAKKPAMLIKPSETDVRDGLCPLIDLTQYKDKRAQRGAERLIDANNLKKELNTLPMMSNWGESFMPNLIDRQPTVEAIPTAWIVAQIQDTSGAESSYYSRLLRKWRDENGI